MIEEAIYTALAPLFGGKVYPDVAPADAAMPFMLYQQVDGEAVNSFCGGSRKYNAVVQFMVWAETRQQANTLMREAEQILSAPPLRGYVEGALVARYDEVTRTRAAMQDISFWYSLPPAPTFHLLLEDGSHLLAESGDILTME